MSCSGVAQLTLTRVCQGFFNTRVQACKCSCFFPSEKPVRTDFTREALLVDAVETLVKPLIEVLFVSEYLAHSHVHVHVPLTYTTTR